MHRRIGSTQSSTPLIRRFRSALPYCESSTQIRPCSTHLGNKKGARMCPIYGLNASLTGFWGTRGTPFNLSSRSRDSIVEVPSILNKALFTRPDPSKQVDLFAIRNYNGQRWKAFHTLFHTNHPYVDIFLWQRRTRKH